MPINASPEIRRVPVASLKPAPYDPRPAFCDVIVERWQAVTGAKAIRHGPAA